MANEDVQKTLEELSRNLQESKARLEEAQRVAHLGYWVWNLETNHLIWSDETYRIFGLTPQEELIDLNKLREMIHPDDRESMFRKAQESLLSGVRTDAGAVNIEPRSKGVRQFFVDPSQCGCRFFIRVDHFA